MMDFSVLGFFWGLRSCCRVLLGVGFLDPRVLLGVGVLGSRVLRADGSFGDCVGSCVTSQSLRAGLGSENG